MADTIPVTIVGGGLAGLTLGIALRQHNVPVQLHESGHYPRHRVCGEFISGHGQASLERLGLRSMLDILGEHGDSEFAAWSMTHIAGIRRAVAELPVDVLIDGEAVGDTLHVFDLLESKGNDMRQRR